MYDQLANKITVLPKRTPLWLVLGGAALYVLMSVLWWQVVYQNPERVYWDMLDNSLKTTSVTRELHQKTEQSQLNQTIVQTFGRQYAAQALTELKQGSDVIKTESIGTASKDYIRYAGIVSSQKNADGKALDFKPVLNRWAQNDAVNNSSNADQQASFLTEVTFGVMGGNLVPIANLPEEDRNDLINLIQNTAVFKTNFKNVKKQWQHGRPVFIYETEVQPVAYVGFEKYFGKKIGLHWLDNLEPNDYQKQPVSKVKLTIDGWSHQLAAVSYEGQQRQETYGSYGIDHLIQTPSAKLSGTQLQELVNKVR